MVARAEGRISGVGAALHAFHVLDPGVRSSCVIDEGARRERRRDTIAHLRGPARALLTAERTALNLLGHLSGVATVTRGVVRALEGLSTRVVCTRKTTPGLRALEKQAVRAGGGSNHRFGLDDAVLIKDNHRAIAGGVTEAVARARRAVGHMVKIEVEVDTLAELEEALASGWMSSCSTTWTSTTLRTAVRMARGRALTEASGGHHAGDRPGRGGHRRRHDLDRLADAQRPVARRGAGRGWGECAGTSPIAYRLHRSLRTQG